MNESWRLFWGIELPRATREALAAALAPLRRGAPGLRWTSPESWHITAYFLGDVAPTRVPEIVEAGARAAARAQPLELVLRGLGRFPESGNARVHWIGCDGELEALRAAANELALEMVGLGLPVDEKPLIPHVTIARAPRRG
ncbi:MAG: RNA 2',3'-cyclic phosphodiesterase [Planctomycetes bacterium]|nr:RNA 2',3'-cyclic phosphodiesterase [Planctomycetota bacterium]